MRCRMKDYLRVVILEYFHHPCAILHIGNNSYNIQIWEALSQLHFYRINAIFSMSENQQFAWCERSNLSA
ncbi:hypothetical protein D3C75_1038650 [compost metagenome]